MFWIPGLLSIGQFLTVTHEPRVFCQHPRSCGKVIVSLPLNLRPSTVFDIYFFTKITVHRKGQMIYDFQKYLTQKKTREFLSNQVISMVASL